MTIDVEKIVREAGKPVLSDLVTDHMDAQEANVYQDMLKGVKRWRTLRTQVPGLSLLLLSRSVNGNPTYSGYGVGKTTILRALQWTIGTVFSATEADGGDEAFSTFMVPSGIYWTASEAIAWAGDHMLGLENDLTPPVFFLDDVGREVALKFVAGRDQEKEVASRLTYFVDYCYERKIGLVIAANYSPTDFSDKLGGAAHSRFTQMTTHGDETFRFSLTGIPDYRVVGKHRD